MPSPYRQILYCVSQSFSSSMFGTLSPSPPGRTTASIFCGWNVGNNNPPLYCEMNFGTEVRRTSTQWLAAPTQSRPTNNAAGTGRGNSWVTGPWTGEYLADNWIITMSLAAVSSNDDHTGQFIYRIWKGSDISGSNATLVSPTFYSSSLYDIITVNVPVLGSASLSVPGFQCRNEYVFLQTYWRITVAGAGAGTADDHDYIFSQTSSLVQTAPFVADKSSFFRWVGNSND